MQYQKYLKATFILLILVFPSCKDKSELNELITKFQKNSETTTVAIKAYYNSLNEYERNLYLLEVSLNDSLEVSRYDSAGKETPLFSAPFPEEAIQKRVEILYNISKYAGLLGQLISNDTPERLKSETSAFTENLITLRKDYDQLADNNSDSQFEQYIGPIGAIVGILGKIILESKIENALIESITLNEKPIDTLLKFLSSDLEKYIESTRITGFSQTRSQWIMYYNTHKQDLSLEKRQFILEQINQVIKDRDVFLNSKPSKVVESMRKVHSALVKYVTSGGNNEAINVGSILNAVNKYQQDVKQLVEATIQIKGLLK